MPAELKFPADQAFFAAALDAAAVIVHGRNSFEDQPRSAQRRRIVVTRRVAALDGDPANPKATLWNPAGAPFADACRRAGVASGAEIAVGFGALVRARRPTVRRVLLSATDTSSRLASPAGFDHVRRP